MNTNETLARIVGPVFDTEDCSRCGGTGRMPFALDGGKCFKCRGRAKALTPTAAHAKKVYDEVIASRCTKTAVEIVAGDKIWISWPRAAWREVTEVGVGTNGVFIDCGVEVQGIELISNGQRIVTSMPSVSFKIQPTGADIEAGIDAIKRRKGWH